MNKTAICLALVAAVAAPLLLGTWRTTPNAQSWVALTPEHRARILVKLDSSMNCRYFETQIEVRDVIGVNADQADIQDAILCHHEQDALRDGGEMQAMFSLPRYLAINTAFAMASGLAFLGVFLGLATVLPVLARRYRRDAAT